MFEMIQHTQLVRESDTEQDERVKHSTAEDSFKAQPHLDNMKGLNVCVICTEQVCKAVIQDRSSTQETKLESQTKPL